MIRITISAMDDNLANLVTSLAAVGEKSMPATADAFRFAATKLLLPRWKSFASGNPLKGFPHRLKSPTGGYAASIKAKRLGPFDWYVHSESPVARWLEEGTDEVDFKKTHTRGRKSRVAYKKEDGKIKRIGYLIVPFRHHTPKARMNPMPEIVYKMVQAQIKRGELQKSAVEKAPAESGRLEANWPGELIPRATYSWGGRLKGLAAEFANLEGMVVFDTGSTRIAHSTYFTFRVISSESPPGSWIKPATPAMNITKAVWDACEEDVEDLIEYGLKKDLGL